MIRIKYRPRPRRNAALYAAILASTAVLASTAGLASASQIQPQALDALPPADVTILGELHDNPIHHLNQARAVRALAPAAIVWEMLTEAQAARMPERRDDADMVEAALGWAESGWPDYALYHPITEAAGAARHYGAHVPRAQAREAFAQGAAPVFGAQAARFGLQLPLDPAAQALREAAQFEAHCRAMPEAMMAGLVEAQRLRDASLAQAVLMAMEQTGGPVVVITGNGHARHDHGVPALLQIAAPEVSVLSLGQFESDAEAASGEAVPHDLWLVTAPHPRPDPCAAFAPPAED
ncbi:ChaN family lipoprotein [Pararhodobacter oceanensis]|uniref:Haem-binding uptake Tiki superfamily ChaN domain-containing protein n=1 Tax=Pararhodobacter oceanensis TaxID=2172121 RepID=A0A2T8HVJ0_9RHOB|nr:ChaN family lipoprotein [Pararhodobacter oceanensis]PVH29431.1 hypothetical protein DDE20_04660 [Pararhodobacter oceanensis]